MWTVERRAHVLCVNCENELAESLVTLPSFLPGGERGERAPTSPAGIARVLVSSARWRVPQT